VNGFSPYLFARHVDCPVTLPPYPPDGKLKPVVLRPALSNGLPFSEFWGYLRESAANFQFVFSWRNRAIKMLD
jgi:hypothetical protein